MFVHPRCEGVKSDTSVFWLGRGYIMLGVVVPGMLAAVS